MKRLIRARKQRRRNSASVPRAHKHRLRRRQRRRRPRRRRGDGGDELLPRRSSRNSRASARRSVNKTVRRTREKRRSLSAVVPLLFLSLSPHATMTIRRHAQCARTDRRRDRRRAKQTSETDGSPTTGDLGRGEEVSEVGEGHRRPIRSLHRRWVPLKVRLHQTSTNRITSRRVPSRTLAHAGRSSPFFRFRLFCSFSPYTSRALSGRVSLPPLSLSLGPFLSRAVFRPSSHPDRRHRHYRSLRLSLPSTFSFSYSHRSLGQSCAR